MNPDDVQNSSAGAPANAISPESKAGAPAGSSKPLSLEDRIAEKRARVEKAYGLPHAGAKVDAKEAPAKDDKKAEAKPLEEHTKALAAKDTEIASIRQEMAARDARLAEWDELAEQVSARMDTMKRQIAQY